MLTLETDARVISGIGFLLAMLSTTKKIPPIGIETLGGRALQGLVTPLEIDVPYLRLVWAYQREARRRREAKPARASKESVAVVGSGTTVDSGTVVTLS